MLVLLSQYDCGAQLLQLSKFDEPFLVCSLLLDQFAMGDPPGALGSDNIALWIPRDTQTSPPRQGDGSRKGFFFIFIFY